MPIGKSAQRVCASSLKEQCEIWAVVCGLGCGPAVISVFAEKGGESSNCN